MRKVVQVSAHTAQHAEDHLHEEGRFDPPLVDEPGEVVQVAEVVALELEPGAVCPAQLLHDVLEIGEGVLEDQVARRLEEVGLPVVFPLVVLPRAPPVEMLTTASVSADIRGRNRWNSSGRGSGLPVCGSRACKWTMAAPARTASMEA
ncbi:hypothetical protein M271_01665 [Streptomyces rapamycinicus NRRL 5491]|nr:hypothetical protein M271_01665 [Streptomyces rapamycinicus NRRL 5491]